VPGSAAKRYCSPVADHVWIHEIQMVSGFSAATFSPGTRAVRPSDDVSMTVWRRRADLHALTIRTTSTTSAASSSPERSASGRSTCMRESLSSRLARNAVRTRLVECTVHQCQVTSTICRNRAAPGAPLRGNIRSRGFGPDLSSAASVPSSCYLDTSRQKAFRRPKRSGSASARYNA
jgi:hypothetical protein